MIVDVEASTAIRQAEVTATKTMLERTSERFGLEPARLAADTAYGSAKMLSWLVHDQGIEPHIPVFDKSARKDGTFSRDDFSYDHKGDTYICPEGKTLKTRGTLVNTRYCKNGRLCHLTARTKESRDAVCASQAHPENGPSPIARPDRSSRRVPPRSHRPKPQKDG